jgi:WD40 repeat protein/tetratricopeptide (TPR) repeat protein
VWDVGPVRVEVARYPNGQAAWAHAVAWSPSGKKLAFSGGGQVYVVEPATGRTRTVLLGHTEPVRAVSWAPDDLRLATAAEDQTVRLWNAETGKELAVLQGHADKVWSVCWSPDGSRLASGGADHTIRLWDAQTARPLNILRGHTAAVRALRWGPDRARLASAGEDATVRVWDVQALPETLILSGHNGDIRTLAWSPDGRRLAAASNETVIRLWDPDTGKQVGSCRGHTCDVLSLCWAPDGRLASGTSFPQSHRALGDHCIKIWDGRTGKEVLAVRTAKPGMINHRVTAVAWSPDGRRLATVNEGWNLCIRVWDTDSGKEVATLPADGGWTISSLSWGPHGLLASAGETRLWVWDVKAGRLAAELTGHAGTVLSVSWSPDGNTLASGGTDGAVRLWDRSTWQQKAVLSGHTGPVAALAWNPDGSRLATGSDDHTVKVWDPESSQETLTLRGHNQKVRTVAWSPDGNRLAAGGFDGKVHIWDAGWGHIAERSPAVLPELEHRLAGCEAGTGRAAALRLRARIRARQGWWDDAARDWEQAHREAPSSGMFVAGWWRALPPEEGGMGPTGTEEELPWQPVAGGEENCLLLSACLPQIRPARALVRTRVYIPAGSSAGHRIVALAGSITDLQVSLNGLPVQAPPTSLLLRPGWNTLVFAVTVGATAHFPTLSLSDTTGDRLQTLSAQGRWEEAVRLAGEAPARNEDGLVLLQAARALRGRAEQLRRQGRPEQALEEFRRARSCCERLLALHPDHPGYTLELAELVSAAAGDGWVLLKPLEVKSANGATLTCLPDLSILAGGTNPDRDTYTVTSHTLLEGITAFRLETLPHPGLPHGGPGRFPGNGNFNLSEFQVNEAGADDTAKAGPVPLTDAWADFAAASHDARRAIDGNPQTWWDTWPRHNEARTAVFATRTPIGGPGGTVLTVRLDFSGHAWKGHGLGRFRLAVTTEKEPLVLTRKRAFVSECRGAPPARLGVAYALAGEWKNAREALTRAVAAPSADPAHERAWLALACARLGLHDEARKWATITGRMAKSSSDEVKELVAEVLRLLPAE